MRITREDRWTGTTLLQRPRPLLCCSSLGGNRRVRGGQVYVLDRGRWDGRGVVHRFVFQGPNEQAQQTGPPRLPHNSQEVAVVGGRPASFERLRPYQAVAVTAFRERIRSPQNGFPHRGNPELRADESQMEAKLAWLAAQLERITTAAATL